MFWSGSGAFIRRHVDTGGAQYFSWTISFSSRRDASGSRRLDILHLSCSRRPLGAEARRMGEFEIRLAARDGAGEEMTTDRLLCLRASAQAIDLWIAAAGPVVRSGQGSRRRALLTVAPPAIEAAVLEDARLLDGGTIVLDGSGDARRG